MYIKFLSNVLVEGFRGEFTWTLVRPSHLIKPHEQVTKVVFEKGMMDVMIGGSAKSQDVKEGMVPRKGVLGMDESQPVGVGRTKGHVGPHVDGIHDLCRTNEWNENHAHGIQDTSVKGIEEARVGELVMRLVRPSIKRRTDIMFQAMHDVLDSVLQDEAHEHLVPFDAVLEAIIGIGHDPEHPRPR